MEPTVKSATVTIRKWSAWGGRGGLLRGGDTCEPPLEFSQRVCQGYKQGQNIQAEGDTEAEAGGSRTGQGFCRVWLVGPENRKKGWMEGKMGWGLAPDRWAGGRLFFSVTEGTGHV